VYYFTLTFTASSTWTVSPTGTQLASSPPASGSLAGFNNPPISWPGTNYIYFGQYDVKIYRADTSLMSGVQNTMTGQTLAPNSNNSILQKTVGDRVVKGTVYQL
jgi:hypothetical protein